jgi:hypothetical protein
MKDLGGTAEEAAEKHILATSGLNLLFIRGRLSQRWKRCATQNRDFSATCEAGPFPKNARETEFSADCEVVPFHESCRASLGRTDGGVRAFVCIAQAGGEVASDFGPSILFAAGIQTGRPRRRIFPGGNQQKVLAAPYRRL